MYTLEKATSRNHPIFNALTSSESPKSRRSSGSKKMLAPDLKELTGRKCPFSASLGAKVSSLFPLERQDFSMLSRNAILPDLSAQLVCTLQASGEWEFNLTQISGSKVFYLLGREFTKSEYLSLDSLIPEKRRSAHHLRVESILNEGPRSIYWEQLFTGNMTNPLTIVSPFQASPREIKIYMTPCDSELSNSYVFNVCFVDQTATNSVATKAGAITHDLRGFLRSGLAIMTELAEEESLPKLSHKECISLSPEALALRYEQENAQKIITREKINQVMELLQEGMKMCSPSRRDFLPDAFVLKQVDSIVVATENLFLVDERLTAFIDSLRNCQHAFKASAVNLTISANSLQSLASEKIDILERFLLNLIKNAIEATATQVEVTCFSSSQADQLICEVTDNGSGIDEPLLSTFFNRAMPKRKVSADIEAKRGEGTLMANAAWESLGGAATGFKRQDGASGTTFRLSLPLYSSPFFKPAALSNATRLNQQQLSTIQGLNSMTELQGIILIADDQLINLKLLMRTIAIKLNSTFNHRASHLRQAVQTSWQEQSLSLDFIDQWAIICTANGEAAYDVVKNCRVSAIITDQEMPGAMKGTDLIEATRALEQTSIGIPIALNTGTELERLDKKRIAHLLALKITYIVKGNAEVFNEFMAEIIKNARSSTASPGCPALV